MDAKTSKAAADVLDPSSVVICLRGTGAGFSGRLFFVPRGGAYVGRMPECGILLDHPTVSRRHCRIDVGPEGARVTDVGSINGTWINGAMAMESRLHHGDILRIGKVDFVVEIKPAPESGSAKHVPARSAAQTGTTRLMNFDEGASEPIRQGHPQRGGLSRMARLTKLLFGRQR
ncbi:MAG TPA: FHA domain-containing protein [Verrucomicrobiae bacterium]|nr:FHA domain-containing protein [Verrucomicrobiae bacterium]